MLRVCRWAAIAATADAANHPNPPPKSYHKRLSRNRMGNTTTSAKETRCVHHTSTCTTHHSNRSCGLRDGILGSLDPLAGTSPANTGCDVQLRVVLLRTRNMMLHIISSILVMHTSTLLPGTIFTRPRAGSIRTKHLSYLPASGSFLYTQRRRTTNLG